MATSLLSPDRTAFRETVAAVADKARGVLPPEVNGRLEGAVKLVLLGEVAPQEDGTVQVGSCSDPAKVYHLVGPTCECKDFTEGKAPAGWCRHRIAAGLHKRVREILAAMPVPVPVAPAVPLPEAPASCNCHIMIDGRQVQITLRDTDENRLLARLTAVLQQYPAPAKEERPQGWCAIHNVQMKETSKNGRTWWSHRTAEGQWCKGK